MKRISPKRRLENSKSADLKDALMERLNGKCDWCKRPAHDKHELGRGCYRASCLPHDFACLLVCRDCHGILTRMPTDEAEVLGLAILKASRPESYSLARYLAVTTPHAPHRITESEVAAWQKRIGVAA